MSKVMPKVIPRVMPWKCVTCGNKWVDSVFICWINCPECEGESQHETIRDLTDNDVFYTEE